MAVLDISPVSDRDYCKQSKARTRHHNEMISCSLQHYDTRKEHLLLQILPVEHDRVALAFFKHETEW